MPTSILLGNIEQVANRVYLYSHNHSDQEFTRTDQFGSERYIKELFDAAKECLAEIAKAQAAGVPESKTIGIKRQADDSIAQMSLAQIKALCQRALRLTGGDMGKGQAQAAAQYISIWLKLLNNGSIDKTQAEVATETGKTALAEIDEARANGLSDDERIEVFDRTMTVGEAREQIVYIQSEIGKINAKNIAEQEAKYAPFRAALTGDKLALYNSRMLHSGVYGAGGHLLKTPQEYAGSTVWCEWSVDRNTIVASWALGCWHFKGMTRVGNVVNRSGLGDTPPASAFR